MKNTLLVLLTLFSISIFAQEKKIKYQLSIGPTLSVPKTSKLSDSNIDGFPEIKSSINIGVFILPSINYSFNEKTSLDFGFGYYLDRFSIENKIGPTVNKGTRNINQLQVPININFRFRNDNSYQFGIGAFTSFLLSAKEKGHTEIDYSKINPTDVNDPIYIDNSGSYNNNIKGNYNSVNFGAFIQLKKDISFSTNTSGFILIKINQYFNSIKNQDSNTPLNNYFNLKNEKEPTTVNLGIGIDL
jgi:hypothetical protein